MGLEGKDRRVENRNTCKVAVEYLVKCRDSEKPALDHRRTYTADISHNGIGLYAGCCVRQGQRIDILLFNLRKDPIMGEVKWCEKQDEDSYMIGVQFSESIVGHSPRYNLLDFNFS